MCSFLGSFTHLLYLSEECLCGINSTQDASISYLICLKDMHIILLFFTYKHLSDFWCRDYLSPSDIMGRYPHLVVIGTGLTFGYLVVWQLCLNLKNCLLFLFFFLFNSYSSIQAVLCLIFFGVHFSWLPFITVIILGWWLSVEFV